MEELLGHVDINLARRIRHGERRLRDQLRYQRHGQPELVRINGRPGEMQWGFDAWITASAGMVGVYFYDTEQTEYFAPERWVTLHREMIT